MSHYASVHSPDPNRHARSSCPETINNRGRTTFVFKTFKNNSGLSPNTLLPSRLNDTTDFKGFTQELRLSSAGKGPLQWLVGAFFADTDRKYAQRLPTPGYDGFTNATLGAGTAAAVAKGFPLESPYNADIPYNLKQTALFGELSYELTNQLTGTVGGRFYDYKEERTFKSGGLFSNGDNQIDKTKSDGFNPRVLFAYKASDSVTFNAQASKGFRLEQSGTDHYLKCFGNPACFSTAFAVCRDLILLSTTK